jgi:hypothetical protein
LTDLPAVVEPLKQRRGKYAPDLAPAATSFFDPLFLGLNGGYRTTQSAGAEFVPANFWSPLSVSAPATVFGNETVRR